MQYGSAGAGSATHLVCALLDTAIGIKARHVPYDGGAPALRDLVDGRIDYFCPVVTIAIPQIEKKSVKAIAILSKNRAPILPTLASAAEQGLTDFTASTWFAIFLPKGTPEPIVHKLYAECEKFLTLPATREKLAGVGVIVSPMTPAEFAAFIRSEIVRWTAEAKAAGIEAK